MKASRVKNKALLAKFGLTLTPMSLKPDKLKASAFTGTAPRRLRISPQIRLSRVGRRNSSLQERGTSPVSEASPRPPQNPKIPDVQLKPKVFLSEEDSVCHNSQQRYSMPHITQPKKLSVQTCNTEHKKTRGLRKQMLRRRLSLTAGESPSAGPLSRTREPFSGAVFDFQAILSMTSVRMML